VGGGSDQWSPVPEGGTQQGEKGPVRHPPGGGGTDPWGGKGASGGWVGGGRLKAGRVHGG